MDPVVKIKNLYTGFAGRDVLHGITLNIYPSEITVIIGPSGSGKTTLLRSINRLNDLYDDCHIEGTILIRLRDEVMEINNGSIDITKLRRRVAMVFQTPNVLPISIRKNLALPLKLTLGLSKPQIERRIEESLADVELWDEVKDRLHDDAFRLSGGQQQRLCLARAISLEPEILLLDEPTASLDFQATRRIESLLAKLKDKYSIVAVSHSLGQTGRLADRCIVIKDGRVAQAFDRTQIHETKLFQRLVDDIF